MFVKTPLTELFKIDNIITLHCFNYSRDFVFNGESHDFWEMVFVDSGEVGILADEELYVLRNGDCIFHKPGEYHKIWANKSFASVVVITFETSSETMHCFINKKLSLTNTQRQHIAEILREAVLTFKEPLDIVDQIEMIKKPDAPFGAEQIIKTHLEQLFIDMVRLQIAEKDEAKIQTGEQIKYDRNQIAEKVIQILEDNICKHIPLEEICAQLHFSKSYIKSKFKSVTGYSIYQMYIKMKVDFSKRLLSEEKYSITEISEILGFESIHYFSRTFKKCTGMSPSEYQKSVRKRALL